MPSLLLNNKTYTYQQIKKGEFATNTVFEETTLNFCKQWLNGEATFEQKTSGSTGKPKNISITRAQMKLSARNTIEALKLKPNDVALICIDTAYIGGKMMLVRAFEHQFQLIINEPSSNPLENINEPIDFIAMVPMQFENSLNNHPQKIANCKGVIIGGALINNSLTEKIARLKTPIYSTYGMTETVSHIALKRLSQPAENHFTTLGDVKIEINNKEQLIINGSITNHQNLITNDRVEIVSSTEFKWLGRIDNVVNTGGIKIQIEEIERQIDYIFKENKIEHRFFLIGVANQSLGQKLVLCLESSKTMDKMNILEILKSNLEKFHCPKKLIEIAHFSETTNGKILRNQSYEKRVLH